MKKYDKVQLYFGLDCGMIEFLTCEPQPKEQLISLPHFWSTVWRQRLRFIAHANHEPKKQED
jgi:hypothetical protein